MIVGIPGLDRDAPNGRQRYSLVVAARLGAAAAQQGIQLLLDDANDNAPYFDRKHYHVTVEENLPLGKFFPSTLSLPRSSFFKIHYVFALVILLA